MKDNQELDPLMKEYCENLDFLTAVFIEKMGIKKTIFMLCTFADAAFRKHEKECI